MPLSGCIPCPRLFLSDKRMRRQSGSQLPNCLREKRKGNPVYVSEKELRNTGEQLAANHNCHPLK